MISITVRYYSVFCIVTNFCLEEDFIFESPKTIWELIELLENKYSDTFGKKLFDIKKNLLVTAWVLVNSKRFCTENFGMYLQEGDTVIFTTPLLVGG